MNTPFSPSPFTLSSELSELIEGVSAMANSHSKVDIGAIVESVALALVTMGLLVAEPARDTSAFKSTPMPDDWLVQAALLPSAAPSSLRKLQSEVRKRGFVSIEAADAFCAVEATRERKAFENASALASSKQSVGASILHQRVASLGIEATLDEAIANGKQFASDMATVGGAAATIAYGAAATVGKGLGALASVIKKSNR